MPPKKVHLTPVQWAFLIESGMNISSAATMLISPSLYLQYLSAAPTTAQSEQLLQWIGALILTVTAPMLLSIERKPGAGARRKLTYQTLLAGEAVLVPTIAWQAWQNKMLGLSQQSLVIAMASLILFAAWRVFVFYRMPHWFHEPSRPSRPRKKD